MNIDAIPTYVALLVLSSGVVANMGKHRIGSLLHVSNTDESNILTLVLLPLHLVTSFFVAGPIVIWALIKANTFQVIVGISCGTLLLVVAGVFLHRGLYPWLLNPLGPERRFYGYVINLALELASVLLVVLIAITLWMD